MSLRRWAWAMAVVIAGMGGLVAAAPAAREAERIVAIGDLHGDYGAWRDIAQAAGLVDAAGRWTGGRTILVQTGDVVDRGPDSLKIIGELRRLQAEAPRAGGRVVALVGNHEAMNVTGDLRYVHPGEYAAFRGRRSEAVRDRYYADNRRTIAAAARRRAPDLTDAQVRAAWEQATPLGMIEHRGAWHPAGEVGAWVVSNPAVVKLGGVVFVHGGLGGAYAGLTPEEINRRVAAALAAPDQARDAILNDADGPLWYRGLVAGAAADTADAALTRVLRTQEARAMVVGHTPVLKGIAVSYGGRLAQIDTGISAHYGGALSYLEIVGGEMIPRTVARTAARGGER